jgi:tRNA threonylcarbamoyladenosine biosynthesis protein TsaB
VILAIETSTERGSVALGRASGTIAERALAADRRHTTALLPAVHEMLQGQGLKPADVEAVGFSQGPGSFTGLRIAATIARMWTSVTGCRVVAVPTLEVIARNAIASARPPAWHTGHIAVVVDARRGQVFGGLFRSEAGELRTMEAAALREVPAWFGSLPRPCLLIGPGPGRWREHAAGAGLEVAAEDQSWPRAAEVLAIAAAKAGRGEFCPAAEILPLYIRRPECEEVYEQRRATARQRREG